MSYTGIPVGNDDGVAGGKHIRLLVLETKALNFTT